MARRKLAQTFVGIACISAALLVTSAAAKPQEPVPAPAPVSESNPASGVTTILSTGSVADTSVEASDASAQAVCTFYTEGDNVHRSGSDASGHGWWTNINCEATYADVTVWLQEYYSDGSWRNKGTVGRKRVLSGGGSGNRATGRATCHNSSLTGWRSVVDVDLVGQSDSPDILITPSQNIYCRVN